MSSMIPVRIGLLGLGTVGCGTVEVLSRNADEISRRAGRTITIAAAAVRDRARPRPCMVGGIELTTDAMALVERADVDVVVELIGGDTVAREVVLRAIQLGKHVVTANKALIAVHGNEIFDAAQRRGVMVAFEAAVAGGISIIKTIREGLAGNRIEQLAGIINGTTNFILTGMRDEGREFDDMLRDAQARGYAEADPTFDVEGIDPAHKLTILASIAFGVPLSFEHVYTEGITALRREDVAWAEQFGYRIRHLGIARRTAAGIELRVHPTLIPHRRLIANVDGVMNAVLVQGDAVGEVLQYGAGAGAEPTASAVVADLVDVVRAMTTDPENRVPHLAFQPGSLSDLPVVPADEIETAYYLRMTALDRPGVLAEITGILGALGISIEAIHQKEPAQGESVVPVILISQRTRERLMNQALQRIEALPSVAGAVTRIRLEHFNGPQA